MSATMHYTYSPFTFKRRHRGMMGCDFCGSIVRDVEHHSMWHFINSHLTNVTRPIFSDQYRTTVEIVLTDRCGFQTQVTNPPRGTNHIGPG